MRPIVVLIALLLPSLSFAQLTPDIDRIDQKIASLSATPPHCSKTFTCMNGDERSLYICGSSSIITVKVYEKDLVKNVSWYFENNELFYCEQNWQNSRTGQTENRQKFYLQNSCLALRLIDNEPVSTASSEFEKLSSELPAFANAFLKRVRS